MLAENETNDMRTLGLNVEHGTVVIYYISWAMHPKDRKFWCSELNGEVWDCDLKETLKQKAERAGLPWMVIKCHKHSSNFSITERSQAA